MTYHQNDVNFLNKKYYVAEDDQQALKLVQVLSNDWAANSKKTCRQTLQLFFIYYARKKKQETL